MKNIFFTVKKKHFFLIICWDCQNILFFFYIWAKNVKCCYGFPWYYFWNYNICFVYIRQLEMKIHLENMQRHGTNLRISTIRHSGLPVKYRCHIFHKMHDFCVIFESCVPCVCHNWFLRSLIFSSEDIVCLLITLPVYFF